MVGFGVVACLQAAGCFRCSERAAEGVEDIPLLRDRRFVAFLIAADPLRSPAQALPAPIVVRKQKDILVIERLVAPYIPFNTYTFPPGWDVFELPTYRTPFRARGVLKRS